MTKIPKLFASWNELGKRLILLSMLFFNASNSYSKTLTLDEVLLRSKQDTVQQRIMQHEKERELAETAAFKSFALPSLNFELGTSRDATALTNPYIGGVPGAPDRSWDTNHQWNLQFRTILYSFGRTGTVFQIAKQRDQLSEQSHEYKIEQYRQLVVQSFADAHLKQNQTLAASRAVQYAEQLSRFVQTDFNGGAASKIDLLRGQANFDLAKSRYELAKAHFATALIELKVLLGYETQDELSLSTENPLKTDIVNRADQMVLASDTSVKTKEEGILESSSKISTLMADYQSAQIWPSLFFQAGASSRVRTHGYLADPDDPSYGDVWDENRFNYSLGVGLSWTLFDGFKIQSDAKYAAHTRAISEMELGLYRSRQSTVKSTARDQYLAAKSLLASTEASNEASRLNFEKVDQDFRAGQSSLTDRLEAEKDLQNGEAMLFEAYAQVLINAAHLILIHGGNI